MMFSKIEDDDLKVSESIKKIKLKGIGGSKQEVAQGMHASSSRFNFFHFHAVFGIKLEN